MADKILVHTCCADCLIHLVEALEEEKQIDNTTALTLFYYNPNIHPKTEYMERLNAVKLVLKEKYKDRDIKLVVPDYKPQEYFESIAGKERRCLGCWGLRLTKTFEYAKEKGIEYVSSTLLGSHYQDKEAIEKIAKELEDNDTKLVYPLKEHNHSINRGFYKQNFCGCCYSLNEKLHDKYVKKSHN
ncbi:epoxyqueuosine reductase QueH [Patescibacteria group bacterium]|nr:epoxyqueuosine reductase QueH [Patescibacteria group bacterium]